MSKLAYAVAFGAGALSWLYVAQITGRQEAWDSEMYFSAVFPALGLLAGVLGFLVPDRVWRWGLAPFGGQALAAFVQNPTANLLPLGLIVFAVLGGVCAIPAYLGAFVRRRLTRT